MSYFQVLSLSEHPDRHSGGFNELFPRMMEGSKSIQGQCDAFVWFTQSQLQSVIRNGIVPEWFHGIISRKKAEELLISKPPGYFLIRVSESRIGYTLSYRVEDRCRHFMIDVLQDGHYVVVGENRHHRFLQDLVDFHRRNPIAPYTEVLTVACGQASSDKTDYAELLFPQRHLKNNSNSIQPEEDVPPALPHRPNNLRFSTAVSPNSQPHGLYPNLEEEYPPVASPPPAMPVPMTRHKYLGDNPPPNQPPVVPARSNVPLLNQNQVCTITASAPESPSAPSATELSCNANVKSAKNQEAKPSVVANLKNFKKKFQKRQPSQENVYTDINTEVPGFVENTENEYQEITVEQSNPPLRTANGVGLPQEYLHPPPFAPGY